MSKHNSKYWDHTPYLGLRTKRGVDLEEFWERYRYDLLQERHELLNIIQEEGLITIWDNHIYPTRRGFAMSDSLSPL